MLVREGTTKSAIADLKVEEKCYSEKWLEYMMVSSFRARCFNS